MRSTRPVHKRKFKKMLATMHGNDELDREFVSMALAGQTPPRDIPSEDELDRFALGLAGIKVKVFTFVGDDLNGLKLLRRVNDDLSGLSAHKSPLRAQFK